MLYTVFQRQQLEVNKMQDKLKAVECEKTVLSQQITDLLQKMENLSGEHNSGSVDVKSEREILRLQEKVRNILCHCAFHEIVDRIYLWLINLHTFTTLYLL